MDKFCEDGLNKLENIFSMLVTNEYKRRTHESHEKEVFTFLATAIEANDFYKTNGEFDSFVSTTPAKGEEAPDLSLVFHNKIPQ